MKNLLIGLAIGLMFTAVCTAREAIVSNPMQMVHTVAGSGGLIYTTKITTPEGTYRIFTYDGVQTGSGITAVKIK